MTRVGGASLALLLLVAAAWADGMIVPGRAVLKSVRTPDQRALVHFDGATETLVVETTLQGDGREFAWILPLPAAPRVEESTSGLFPTLEVMCGPDVWDRDHRLWIGIGVAGLVAWAFARWGGRVTGVWRLGGCLVVYVIACLVGALYVVQPKMQGGESAGGAVRVLSRESVGAFDTAVLAANDAGGLRAWLDANGFRAPDGIDAVVDDYAAKGWVFVVSKIRRDAEDDRVHAVRPLAFTFPAARAVYPMRLTGAGNDSLALELYVFGPSRAEADGLSVETCDGGVEYLLDEDATDTHAELLRRARGAKCVTKLVGTLDRAAMDVDVELRWVEASRRRETYVSAAVARSVAADFGVGAFFALLVWAERRRPALAWRRRLGMALGGGLVLAALAWTLCPRLPDGSWEIPHGRDRHAIDWWKETREPFHDVRSARAWVAARVAGATNPYTGGAVREEDSPGNYVVSDVDGKIELTIYADRWGGPIGWGGPIEARFDLSSEPPGDRGGAGSPPALRDSK